MKIESSKKPPPTELSQLPVVRPKTAAELTLEREEREAKAARERALGNCPPELVAFAAGLVALVYHPAGKIESELEMAEAPQVRFFDHGGSQAIAFEREGRLWLVFRGTESCPLSESFRDWGTNLSFLPWGWPPRHAGFARAWAKLQGPVREWVAARENKPPLVFCGHSLGGALALAAANDFARQGKETIEAVFTFGAPRVGTWPWTRRYHRLSARSKTAAGAERTLRDVTFRIYSDGDLVTHVPPPLLFVHCGTPVSATQLETARGKPTVGAAFGEVLPPDALGRLKHARGVVQEWWPILSSPLMLALDLVLVLCETAPKHFMRHYAPAFPERSFPALRAPQNPMFVSAVDRLLGGVALLLVGGALFLLWKALRFLYLLSPELTLTGIVVLLVVLVFPRAYPQSPKAPPVWVRLPPVKRAKPEG